MNHRIKQYFCDKAKKKSAEELFSIMNKKSTKQHIYIDVNDNKGSSIKSNNKFNNENFLFPENNFLKHIKDNEGVYCSDSNFDKNNVTKWKKVKNQADIPWYYNNYSWLLLMYLSIMLLNPYYHTSIVNNKNKLI